MAAPSHSKPVAGKLAAAPHAHRAPLPADVCEAAADACKAYKGGANRGGGVPAVAERMAMPPGVLYNKLRGDADGYNQLTLRDLLQIVGITGDISPVQAFARAADCVAFPAPDFSKVSDAALLDLFLQIQKDEGSYHAVLKVALEDGKIEGGELAALTRQYFTWLGAIAEAHARVQGLRHD